MTGPCPKCQTDDRYANGQCKKCSRARVRTYRETHKEEARAYKKKQNEALTSREIMANNLKRKYGITLERFDEMLIESNGRCDLCGKPFRNTDKDPAVDHDHETGEVRGLLHNTCNTAIGLIFEDPEVAEAAARYLRERK